MTNEELQKELEEAQKKVNEGLYKDAHACSYQEFVDEFTNPFLPEDEQIKADGKGWSKDITIDDDFSLDDPFGIIFHF